MSPFRKIRASINIRRMRRVFQHAGDTHESAQLIRERKSAELVYYLRERRRGDRRMKAYHRRNHLILRQYNALKAKQTSLPQSFLQAIYEDVESLYEE
jgi:hypothetical protein